MSPRKLSDRDKQDILLLYRKPEETTSTLANRYNVSSSTISRFLKNNLSEQEYEELIKQKRQSRSTSRSSKQPGEPFPATDSLEQDSIVKDLPIAPSITDNSPSLTPKVAVAPPILQKKRSIPQQEGASFEDSEDDLDEVNVITLEEMLGEELSDEDEDEDEDEDLEDGDEDDWEQEKDRLQDRLKNTEVKVLPLQEANFPQTCYLVIDRSAELITRPLKDFADLGNIPIEEFHQETLPVFDNHRVARRFSHRSQRVIKVPDGRMLEKTCSYLKAKGITRLLLDGQVFALPPSP